VSERRSRFHDDAGDVELATRDQRAWAGKQSRSVPANLWPGKRTSVQMLHRGQPPSDPARVHAAAAAGIAGSATRLPYFDEIQRAFGAHDVSSVRAHVGGEAATATAAMGAGAYASGDHVAFARAPDLRQAAHETAHVVQQRGGVQLDGGVGREGDAHERHADAVADRVVRGESAEALLSSPGRSSGGTAVQMDGPTLPANVRQFAIDFNREFAAQLHAFATASAPAERSRDVHAASGAAVPAERLVQLFTPTQIEKLESFITTHQIPTRLFNGDDVGQSTAQQRILLAGHILSTGRYQPGSFEEGVHARMCGHWVNLVLSYAGAGEGDGAGVREEFDYAGGLSLSVEDTVDSAGLPSTGAAHRATLGTELGVGTRMAPEAGARARFQMQGLPIEQYSMIQPGDWLWIYNDNGSAGGNHSVIFSRWAGGIETFDSPAGPVQYQRAITMSQTSPDAGGAEEVRALGQRFIQMNDRTHITPITHISRVAASARPMQTVEDLIAILGHGHEAETNARFVQTLCRHGGHFQWGMLGAYLHEHNAGLIDQLAAHMTAGQQQVFRDTNDQAAQAGEGQIPLLVRLNERLRILETNAESVDASDASQRTRIEGTHAAHEAATHDDREQLQTEIDAVHTEIDGLVQQEALIEPQVDLYAEHSARLHAAYVERRTLRHERDQLRTTLQASLRAHESMDRAPITNRLGEITARLDELAPIIAELEDAEHDTRTDRRAAQQSARQLGVQVRQRTQHLVQLQRHLDQLVASDGYYTAHGRVSGARFNGSGERRVTGLLQRLDPAPNWHQFIVH
jgi:hypothetical protein